MSEHVKFIGIIPARYASVRFPGKPLVEIFGQSMIQKVYEQASKALEYVYVATDDKRIFDAVEHFGGKVVNTSSTHRSGTDRCAEAVRIIESKEGKNFDIAINIQGDEPFIQPSQILKLMNCFTDEITQIATLIKVFSANENIFDSNKVKVVVDKNMQAIYFSRSVIPYLRNQEKKEDWVMAHPFYLHIGMYAYRKEILQTITQLAPSGLEMAESLEQLRWIENGYHIKTDITEYEGMGIDTPEDLERIIKLKNS